MTARVNGRADTRAPLSLLLAAAVLAATALPADAREQRPRTAPRAAPPVSSSLEAATRDGPQFFSIAAVLARRDGLPPPPPSPTAAAPVQMAAQGPVTREAVARAVAADPFTGAGYRLFPSASPAVSGKWQAIRAEIARDVLRAEACRERGCREPSARLFNAIADELRALPLAERATHVNNRVNAAVRYMSDATRHGVADLWSGPLATLGAAGDCEDYAFAKYALLQAAGMPVSQMRVILLRDRRAGEDHAVLAVKAGDGWQILDNRWDRIESDGEVPHYRPVFAMTGDSLSLFAAPFVESDSATGVSPASAWGADEPPFDLRALVGPEFARAF